MGCGHSKISIYPKKNRSKHCSKKSGAQEKSESEDDDSAVENKRENSAENPEDCDQTKTIKVKPFVGPLLAQTKTSSSQQDFFKMLDEKIRNGPDYNSDSETERALERARLDALLKDWETASAATRSLPPTPLRRPHKYDGRPKTDDRIYAAAMIERTYAQMSQLEYRGQPEPHHLQYQALSSMYQQYQQRRYAPSYNQHGSPIRYEPAAASAMVAPRAYHQPYANGELVHHQYRIVQRSYHAGVALPQQPDYSAGLHRKHYEMT